MSDVRVPCLGLPCRVADCARAAPGRQALEVEEEYKTNSPLESGLEHPSDMSS